MMLAFKKTSFRRRPESRNFFSILGTGVRRCAAGVFFLAFLTLVLAAPAKAQEANPVGQSSPPPVSAAPSKAAPAPSPAPTGGLLGGQSGVDTIDITADQSLERHETERVYIARGHAKAKRGDVVVEADLLKAYDRKKPDGSSEVWRLTAEGNVKVNGKAQSATGQQAEYDIDSRKAVLKGDNLKFITATDVVTAKESLEYWENEQRAIAKGAAEATRSEEGKGTRTVRGDELAIVFKNNEKGEQVANRMEAKGSVHIVTAKDVIFCDQAIYEVAPNTAVLTGKVRITSGASQIKGDKVESNFKTGISRVVNTGSGRVHALVISSKGKKPAKQKAGGKAP